MFFLFVKAAKFSTFFSIKLTNFFGGGKLLKINKIAENVNYVVRDVKYRQI